MIDIGRLKKMMGALPFALDANLPEDARMEMHTAFAELIACRQRVDAAIAVCEAQERSPYAEQGISVARAIRAKLEGR